MTDINDIIKLTNNFIAKHKNAMKLYDTIDDFKQQLLLVALQKIKFYDESKAQISTFLYSCFENEIRQQYRRFLSKNKIAIISVDDEENEYLKETLTYDDIDIDKQITAKLFFSQYGKYLSNYFIERFYYSIPVEKIAKKYNVSRQYIYSYTNNEMRIIHNCIKTNNYSKLIHFANTKQTKNKEALLE